jgi:transposase
METTPRRKHSSEFKTKVVVEALKERDTIENLSKKFDLHPTQINHWKKEFIEKASLIFSMDSKSNVSEEKKAQEVMLDKLYSQIGQLKVENDFLKKKLM